MSQGYPHPKRIVSPFSTFSRLLARILAPCLVFATALTVYPISPWFSESAIPAGSAELLTSADAVDAYENYRSGDFARSAFQALKESVLQSEFTADALRLHCRFAHPEEYGLSVDEVSLGHCSMDFFAAQADEAALFLEQLREIPRESLSADGQLSYDILEWELTRSVQAAEYAVFINPLSPATGVLSELPILLMQYEIRSEEDLDVYLTLLADFPRYFSELLSFVEQKTALGFPVTAYELSAGIETCQALCDSYAADPEQYFLVSSFEESLEHVGLTPEQRDSYAARNRLLLAESVIPACQAVAEGLAGLLDEAYAADPSSPDPAGGSDFLHTAAGLCTIPGRESYYRYLILNRTGTSRTGEELIELITDRMVSDIRAMDELYQTCPEIGEELKQTVTLTDPQLILIDLQSKMRNEFPVSSGAACQIRRIPEALENSMKPAFYLIPPVDAPDEGYIFLNSSSLASPNLYLTLAHEGFPGHLYQTASFAAAAAQDPLRSLISLPGYTEGWATYAERLAYSYLDGYSEPAAEFLRHNASATMALYALCDLNIHLNGWTPADMSHFLQVWVKGLTEETVTDLYHAIAADPGHYLNYHVGAMEFELMREEAQERLGDAFDQKDFHTFLLQTGPCPFPILRQQFEAWLKNAAAA